MALSPRIGIPCFITGLLIPGIFAPAAQARAQLTVAPPIIELKAEAGQVLTAPIVASAGPGQAITVQLVHADFGFDSSDYAITLIRDDAAETTAFSTRGWFSMPQPTYRIPPGKTLRIPLQVRVPDNATSGTHLGAALLRIMPPRSEQEGNQVQTVPEAGPLVFVSVAGGSPPKPVIRRFRVPRFLTRGPLRPETMIDNQGDSYFSYSGTMTLRGRSTKEKVDISRQFVVPGQPRKLRTAATRRGVSGAPTLGSRRLHVGRYEVGLKLRIQPTGTTLTATRTVWIVPAWAWLILGLLLALLSAGLVIIGRWLLEQRRHSTDLDIDHDHGSEHADDEHSWGDDTSLPFD